MNALGAGILNRGRWIRGLVCLVFTAVVFGPVLGLACGYGSDLDPKSCCESGPCAGSRAVSQTPAECCKQSEQAKPQMGIHASAHELKTSLQIAWVPLSFNRWSDECAFDVASNFFLCKSESPPETLYEITSNLRI